MPILRSIAIPICTFVSIRIIIAHAWLLSRIVDKRFGLSTRTQQKYIAFLTRHSWSSNTFKLNIILIVSIVNHQFRSRELLCHIVDRIDSLFSVSLSFSFLLAFPFYHYHYHSLFFVAWFFFPRFFSHARFSNRVKSTSTARIRKRGETRVERGEIAFATFFDKRNHKKEYRYRKEIILIICSGNSLNDTQFKEGT